MDMDLMDWMLVCGTIFTVVLAVIVVMMPSSSDQKSNVTEISTIPTLVFLGSGD
jgi:hypothetical protein